MELVVPAWELNCELLVVEEAGESLLLDAVTVAPQGEGEEHLPAGSPVTWWLVNPSGEQGRLAADLRELVHSEVGCRIGTVEWMGKELLVASGQEDCVVVLLTPA